MPVIGRARVYVCGITPYDTTHVGHAATFVWSDVAVRLLRHIGADVEVARNITDVDDVLVAEAGRRGEAWRSLAAQQTYRFEDDIARLGVLRPAHEPRAAYHIGHVIDLAAALVDLGHCYERRGWVFFRGDDVVERSGLEPDQARGLLAAVDPSHHGDLADGEFDVAVWQASAADEPGWASPWGRGRPGWHAECAAMALVTLGAGIDLHCGGSDLAFPHHAYEAALAEAVTGVRPFARAWLRPGSVLHEGQKMAKSTGNLVFVHDLLERWSAAELRLAILDRHWAQDWEFDEATLESTRDRLRTLRAASLHEGGQQGADDVVDCLSSNLDVPGALAVAEEAGGGAASTVIDVLGLHHHESVRRSAVVPAP